MHRSVVQVDASQGRRGRDTGSYADRGERSEAPPAGGDMWRFLALGTSVVSPKLLRRCGSTRRSRGPASHRTQLPAHRRRPVPSFLARKAGPAAEHREAAA